MFTFIVIAAILIFGTSAYRQYQRTGTNSDKNRSLAWGCALIGSIIGSFFGIAGFGGAIAGTIPGAAIGWLISIAATSQSQENHSHPVKQVETLDASQPTGLYPPINESLLTQAGLTTSQLVATLQIDLLAEERWLTSSVSVEAYALNKKALDASDSADLSVRNSAFEQMMKPAEMGVPHSQVSVGWFLLNGICGAPRNPEEALKWNIMGARQGHPEGANNAGFQLEHGIGTEKDEYTAALWYAYAAARGCEEARTRFNGILARSST